MEIQSAIDLIKYDGYWPTHGGGKSRGYRRDNGSGFFSPSSIILLLNPVILLKAVVSATAAAQATKSRKHHANELKCSDLGWVCVPMVVETYGHI